MNGVFIRMPQYKFPKLADSRDFEYLILDCYKALYPEANVYMYGRQGQKQDGIDIIVQMSAARWCIQCKNYDSVSVAQIDTWIDDCTYYDKHPFQKLIIASAAPEDTKIADHLLYDVKKPFQVEYVSWKRICGYIEQFPNIYQAYYGNLEAKNTFKKDFLAITAKYCIRDFLRLNPINEGMHINLPECLDDCHAVGYGKGAVVGRARLCRRGAVGSVVDGGSIGGTRDADVAAIITDNRSFAGRHGRNEVPVAFVVAITFLEGS